ncbi:uncharacterized protein LOC120337390 [Styela clava]
MKVYIFVTLCMFVINSVRSDGHCFTKWTNGRWVSVGDCNNPSAEDFLQKMRKNVEAKEELKTWHRASNGLYYELFHDKVNYTTAKSYCQKRGGDLASTGIRNTTIIG